jgi:hypothetical protein
MRPGDVHAPGPECEVCTMRSSWYGSSPLSARRVHGFSTPPRSQLPLKRKAALTKPMAGGPPSLTLDLLAFRLQQASFTPTCTVTPEALWPSIHAPATSALHTRNTLASRSPAANRLPSHAMAHHTATVCTITWKDRTQMIHSGPWPAVAGAARPLHCNAPGPNLPIACPCHPRLKPTGGRARLRRAAACSAAPGPL